MTQKAAATWQAALGQLQLAVTRANYDTWLRDTVGLRHEDGRFVVGAQNDFATEWLATRLRGLILRALARVLGHPIDVAFEVVRPETGETPDLLGADTPEIPEMFRHAASPPPALNPALTFDSFVVGDENRLARQAAAAAAEGAAGVNPLLIFGASGLGKTHLLSAIGHAAHAAGRTVVYATAERFGNDYVRALNRGIDAFRSRYRGCDVLLLDDVQFLEGKERFQEEFYHAFNEVHAAGRQVVVSSDRAPGQLSGLSEALRSRLQWGLAADLQAPGYETRLAILREKARQHAVVLPDGVLALIAERACPSVRELEGWLNRVIAFVPLVGGEMTPDVVARALSPLAPELHAEPSPPSADAVIEAVCRRTATRAADLRGRSRGRDVTYARHLAMYLLKEDARRTVAEIGRMLGDRDHSTVLAGIQRITMELTTRPETRDDAAAVRAALATPATLVQAV